MTPTPPDGAELLLLAHGWMASAPSGQSTPGGQRPCPVDADLPPVALCRDPTGPPLLPLLLPHTSPLPPSF